MGKGKKPELWKPLESGQSLMFVQWQNCTLGGQDVSYETQSKSVFRIKVNVKILKIQTMTIKKLTQKMKNWHFALNLLKKQKKNKKNTFTIIKTEEEMLLDFIVWNNN